MERILILTLSDLELGVCSGTQMQVPRSQHPEGCEERSQFFQTSVRLPISSEDWQLKEQLGEGVFVYLLLDLFIYIRCGLLLPKC